MLRRQTDTHLEGLRRLVVVLQGHISLRQTTVVVRHLAEIVRLHAHVDGLAEPLNGLGILRARL